ncbi:aminotransferase class IV [Microbulbifer thermotolerans]|uniref:Aminotransferase class IV n=1 Tax=Microbulbifer thermotolerans TaxID=252514 RepID=A0A143HLC7_MICTH|nr:aminotransferase class IV [Microbulbifer thermotolerans]AMX02498.1 hypothetical protein A3224_07785 [Microbulbifer thermotolerans]MCX2779352.1 aminotransferase class IV [Microbulbifer thermotolerans]MCX2782444.1 aminotransferase class IV [Microbulbifer thermotolerans]MCX2795029.1 aminotransferase class IV [Microbulbifer thermotolerans]MCX2800597.1 aminotransferase class IV [Microbulbifer thermotolerans]
MSVLPLFFLRGRAVAALPPDDDYTDGLLETMRCQSGSLPLWPLHRARLLRGESLRQSEIAEIDALITQLAAACPVPVARARLRWGIIDGRRQWDLSLFPLEQTPGLSRGVRLYVCDTRLPTIESANPGCKTLARARYNRAKAELPSDEPCDGLLLDCEGRVIESLRCNLLIRSGSAWVTPNLHRCGVRGVMREWLGSRIVLREADMDLEYLCAAQEVALCNSLRGVMPVREIIGLHRWSLGSETGLEVPRLQQLIAEELW